ncbi:MAG: class I SAM-dependent methyltransferase [Paracoccaceae bacterium]
MAEFDPDEIVHAACPVCGGDPTSFAEKSGYQVMRCRSCRFGFVTPVPDEASIIAFYTELGGHARVDEPGAARDGATMADVMAREAAHPNSTVDAARLAAGLRARTGGRLLDVGCGYGFFSKAAMEAGFDVTALELSDHERGIAAEMVPGLRLMGTSFESFTSKDSFDAVLMSQVLEHAREPRAWLSKARALVREGGVIAVALPNFSALVSDLLGARDPYLIPPAHLNYFTPNSLASLMQQTGWQPIGRTTVSRFPVSTFTKRFGGVAGKMAYQVARASLPVLDGLGKGTMINIYARAI